MCTYTVFHRIRADSRIATHLTAVAKLVVDDASRFILARIRRYHRDRSRCSAIRDQRYPFRLRSWEPITIAPDVLKKESCERSTPGYRPRPLARGESLLAPHLVDATR